ncbi:MAG: hypothetical protein WA584_13220 [Pyrinomonadaceae bacterium]
MDKLEIIEQLKERSKCFELYEVTTYKGYRTGKDGNVQDVNIEIFDAGEGKSHRYHVEATTNDGKMATGNPQDSLNDAITLVHWQDLDT